MKEESNQFGDSTWAITPDAIWTGSERLENVSVAIQGERIVEIFSQKDIKKAPNISMPGCTLIPGLIDAHVHLSEWMLPGFLAAGVTTVRDVGNELEWILRQRQLNVIDPSRGPRIFCCGPVLDGAITNWSSISIGHVDEIEIASSVKRLIESGVDAIKLYANLSAAQISSAVNAASESGAFVLAHLGAVNSELAATLGVNEIEHLSGCIHHEHGGESPFSDAAYLEECVKAFLRHGTIMCPTLIVWNRLSNINEVAFANDKRLEWVHPFLLNSWSEFPHRYIDASTRLNRQLSLVTMKRALFKIWSSGVDVIAGTDTPWPYVIPGFSIHDELALAVDCGISPADALKMATINPARVLGLSGEIGEISIGATADLVAINGDPTKDIHHLSNVNSVVHRGVMIDQTNLKASRERLFQKVPDDAISKLITSVSETQTLPISPPVKFEVNVAK